MVSFVHFFILYLYCVLSIYYAYFAHFIFISFSTTASRRHHTNMELPPPSAAFPREERPPMPNARPLRLPCPPCRTLKRAPAPAEAANRPPQHG